MTEESEESKKTSEEAKELASQINFQVNYTKHLHYTMYTDIQLSIRHLKGACRKWVHILNQMKYDIQIC